MAGASFRIEGLEQLTDLLRGGRAKIKAGCERALYGFAEDVMASSKEVVPVLTGALMATGKVMPPQTDGTTTTVTLGYGDESTPYALYVHEELESPHGHPINWTRPGSGPKYLERPLREKQGELPQRVVDAVYEALKP